MRHFLATLGAVPEAGDNPADDKAGDKAADEEPGENPENDKAGDTRDRLPLAEITAAVTTLLTALGALAVSGLLQRAQINHGSLLASALACVTAGAAFWFFAAFERKHAERQGDATVGGRSSARPLSSSLSLGSRPGRGPSSRRSKTVKFRASRRP